MPGKERVEGVSREPRVQSGAERRGPLDRVAVRGVRAWRPTRHPVGRAGTLKPPPGLRLSSFTPCISRRSESRRRSGKPSFVLRRRRLVPARRQARFPLVEHRSLNADCFRDHGPGHRENAVRRYQRRHYLGHTGEHASATDGLPLGMVAVKFWNRKKFKGTAALKRKINPTRVPIEGKESMRWLANLRQSTELLGQPSRCIHIADRVGDIWELFYLARELDTHFLVRRCVDRVAAAIAPTRCPTPWPR